MSIKVTSRVWESSNQRGSDLLLLLALGDRSDDDGISWPGIEELSFKTRVDFRQVKRMIKHVESDGELYVLRGIGRGHSSRYFVTSGLESQVIQSVMVRRLKVPPLMASNLAIDLGRRQASASGEKVTSPPPFIDCSSIIVSGKKVSAMPPFLEAPMGDNLGREKVIFETEKVTSGARKGDILGHGITESLNAATLLAPNHHEPSHESPHEPSHTQGVSVILGQKSRFDRATCKRFADQLPGINNSGGYAKAIWRSGDDDLLIDEWLNSDSNGAGLEQWKRYFLSLLSDYRDTLKESDERLDLIRSAIDLIPRCASRADFQGTLEELRESGLEL